MPKKAKKSTAKSPAKAVKTKQPLTVEQEIAAINKIYREFLVKIEKIRAKRDKIINEILTKAEQRKLAKIRQQLKK